MRTTRFGTQPAYTLIKERRLKISAIAREIDVYHPNLRSALLGTVAPNPDIIEKLSKTLGLEPTLLFTREALAAKYHSGRGVYDRDTPSKKREERELRQHDESLRKIGAIR